MEEKQIVETKKRSMQYLDARELEYRLRSKEDFYVYLDEHRKSYFHTDLIIL